MKVTPLEIRQQQFPLRFRGLDPEEVDKFLELVAADMEDLVRENARLRDSLARKDQELQRMQQGEDELKKALTAIQQIREEWIGRAEKQAEQVVIESEQKAKQLQVDAEREIEGLRQDVQQLKHQRQQLVGDIRHILQEHLQALERLGDEGAESAVHPPPQLEAAEPQRDEDGPAHGEYPQDRN
jgi:cell division initiation protein